MRFKKLDLNLLVALDHMFDNRSITAAADKMFMSQSAMSNALTRLRTYFDDPLLVQVGRKMELTPRAESLQPLIRDILVRTEAAIETNPVFDPQNSDRIFSILLSDYSLRVIAPSVLRIASEENAKVQFNFRAQKARPYTLLEQGEVDILVVPEDFMSKEHPATLLYEEEYVVVAWRGGLYGKNPLTRKEYEAAGHITMVPPQKARSADERRLANAGLTRNVEVTTFSFSTLPHLITGTNRISTIHKRLAYILQDRADLVTYPLPADILPMRQMMQWHTYRETDPGIAWLRSIFEKAALEMPKHLSNQYQ